MQLAAVHFGEFEAALAVPQTARQSGRNRLAFLRGEFVEEWFVNDTRGLEQGWTIARKPEDAEEGPVRLELSVRGNLQPSITPGAIAFRNDHGAVLTYGGLKAWDGQGRDLAVRFVSSGDAFAVEVDDRGALYPITIDPLAQTTYFKASNTAPNDAFGSAIAVSGNTVVIGAPQEDSAATGVNGNQVDNSLMESGAAYVFVRNGTQWSQQAYLKASNPSELDQFGSKVAIDGNITVVGVEEEDSNATGINQNGDDDSLSAAGAAYVFVRNGTIWKQQAYLKASNTSAGAYFGSAVGVSGNTIVVGSSGEKSDADEIDGDQSDTSASGAGAAYVFVRNGSTWTQQAYLKASNSDVSDAFGGSAAISGDTIVVGANQEDSVTAGSGAAYVFVRNGTTWSQQAFLKAFNPDNNDRFGQSVSISGDTVVVGAIWEDSNANAVNGDETDNSATDAGSAYVFVRTGTQWSQQAYLKASNSDTDDWFARSVAIVGNTIVVGADREDSNATGVNGNELDNTAVDSGAAYVYTRTGTIWSQRAYLKAADTGQGDQFGWAVATSGDWVFAGAPGEDSGSSGINGETGTFAFAAQSGAAYLFQGAAPALQSLAKSGESTAGAPDLAFAGPSLVALSDNNDAALFETGLSGSGAGGGRNRGIFAALEAGPELLLRKRDDLSPFGAGFVTNQVANAFTYPSMQQAFLGGIFQVTATGPGLNATNNRALILDNGSFLKLFARTGQSPVGFAPAVAAKWTEVLQSHDVDLLLLTLGLRTGTGGVTLANDTAILALEHDGDPYLTNPAPREGDPADGYTGNAGDLFGQMTGRAAAGRGTEIHFTSFIIPSGGTAVAHLIQAHPDGTNDDSVASQGATASGTGGATFKSFPAVAQTSMGCLFRATLDGPPASQNEGLWFGSGNLILQKGKEFDVVNFPGITVSRILRFWPAGADSVVILATLAGPGVSSANNTALLLRQPSGTFFALLRTGDVAPGCLLQSVKIGSIQSVEVDPVNGHYAVTGSLRGAPASSNQALWAGNVLVGDDFSNQQLRRPTLRLRKGDPYSSNQTARDIVRTISLKTAPDPTGAGGRGFGQAVNRRGMIAITITGDRRVQELVSIRP